MKTWVIPIGDEESGTGTGTVVSAKRDLVEIIPDTGKSVRVLSMNLMTQDAGDAEAENLLLQWIRGHSTQGSGGLANVTCPPVDPNVNASMPATINVLNDTEALGGTPEMVGAIPWATNVPLREIFVEGEQPWATGESLLCRFANAPADAISISGSIVVEIW